LDPSYTDLLKLVAPDGLITNFYTSEICWMRIENEYRKGPKLHSAWGSLQSLGFFNCHHYHCRYYASNPAGSS